MYRIVPKKSRGEVDEREETIKFYQEIYDNKGNLVEVHEKFPTDLGHRRIKNKGR
ncbi:MAG: hypothetical protein KAT65_11310 [Methanophagales archaeon]|nr:hypothetical protein [Methanophagales archaeon]